MFTNKSMEISPNFDQRILSVDIARGLTVLFMIEAHIPISLEYLDLIRQFMRVVAGPFFLIISGISYDFFLSSRSKKLVAHRLIMLESLLKGTIIYIVPLIPYFLSCIFFPSECEFTFFHWGVFQVIGIGYIFSSFISSNFKSKLFSIFSVFVLNIIIHHFFPETLFFLINDKFPIFPYLGYFLFGRLVYGLYYNYQFKNNRDLFIFSTLFLIMALFIFNVDNVVFDPSTRGKFSMFFMLSSLQFGILSFFIVTVDRMKLCCNFLNPLANIGKIAFTSYYIHLLIIYGIISILSISFNKPFSPILNVIIFILVTLLLISFEKMWNFYDYKLGMEWITRKGTQKIIKYIQSNFQFFK